MVNEWTRKDLPGIPALRQADEERGNGFRSVAFQIALDVVVEHLNRAHPKPAREVTRDDLPDVDEAAETYMTKGIYSVQEGIALVLDAVVAHLNANGGVPQSADSTYGIPSEDYKYVDWPATCAAERAAADRAESDRDRWRRAHEIVEQERDQAREQRDIWAKSAHEFRDIVETAERERDEWKAGAQEWQLLAKQERERAEAAEARTAPAVSYEHLHQEVVAAYEYGRNPMERVEFIVKYMCDLFGVEAEQPDPVTEKARELAGVMHEAIKDERAEWHTAPAAVDAMAARLAAHVLGQEAKR